MSSTAQPLALDADVSVATAAYGNAGVTRRCLDSLLLSATGDFELLLIDDCSPDGGATRALFEETKRRHGNTRVYSFTENLEYSGSVNAILSHAQGRWVFFISNDIFITPYYLRVLLEVARDNPRAGILRGSSNFVDNGLPSHNVRLAQPVHGFQDLLKVGESCASRYDGMTQADPFLVGDAFLASRAVIKSIGTFDPLFFGYFADLDYGLRAQMAGFDLRFVPGAFAYHQKDANFNYLPEQQRQEKLSRRWMRVFENWARFKIKYDLPVALAYTSIQEIPWASLAATPFDSKRHYSPPADYSRYRL